MSIVTVQNKINTEKKLLLSRLNNYATLLESGALSFESIAQKDKMEFSLEENILVAELIKENYATPYTTNLSVSNTSLDPKLVDSVFEKNIILFIKDNNSYDYVYPIEYNNSIVGIFHVNFLDTNIKTRILKYGYLILFLNLFGLIASIIMIRFLVRKGILKGLAELMKGSEALTKGDLDYVLQIHSNDEIGDLSSSFNHMTEDLRKTTVSRDLLIKEVSEREKAEEELRISRERLKTASSILRHDITNDLVVIKSAVDIYREEGDDTMIDEIDKRVEKSIETIHHQRDQVKFLYSHADLDEYDLKEVLQKVLNNYPDLEISVTGKCKVYADNAIYSIFDNIIGNAVKHGKTYKLDIEIISDKEHCEIRFKDHGIGVPDEIKDKVFDEGFQYGETGHTGIGLYIVRKTVEEYGGMVFIEDNTPQGAIFIIRLNKAVER
jgi:signal transduction histidine kinase